MTLKRISSLFTIALLAGVTMPSVHAGYHFSVSAEAEKSPCEQTGDRTSDLAGKPDRPDFGSRHPISGASEPGRSGTVRHWL